MLPSNLLIKIILTPLIIAAATLVSRRWGERIGGLMVGLPLTSGPVSIFFALEQGRTYAANAALGSILGLIAVAVFCVSYVKFARRVAWYTAAALSVLLYFVAVTGISLLSPGLNYEIFLVPAILVLALTVMGHPHAADHPTAPPWWDLPLRMMIATLLLVLITTFAGVLGPKWGGLLSPFPIFTFVMATFSHSQGGPSAAWRLMRGVLLGLFSYTTFFVVVALLVEKSNLLLVYSVASLAALAVNGVSLLLLVRNSRSVGIPLSGTH